MNYDLPQEIKSAQCKVLQNNETIYTFNGTTRTTWIRSGTKWYKNSTYSNVGSYSNYNCVQGDIEYEYSYNEMYYRTIAFALVAIAIVLVFNLLLKPILRGHRG